MNNIKIFTEVGIGNASFVSTEIEEGEHETRQPGFVKMRLRSVYIRLWIGYRVYILGLRCGLVKMTKPRKAFKLLIGFEGVPK